jgi:phosphatidate cytidylyltransferase
MAVAASNLVMRLATAAVAVPVILALTYLGPAWGFYLLVFVVSLVGARELFGMTHPGDAVAQGVGVATSALASLAVYMGSDQPRVLLAVLVAAPVLGLLFTLVRRGPIETAAFRAFALGIGPVLIVVPLTLLAVMRRTQPTTGSGAVLLALGLAWFADTGAYFAGRFFGRHKLYPLVSPNKTVEGAVGGLLASVVWALLGTGGFLRGELPFAHAIPLGIVGGALGQAGDLGESLLKRSTGIKDSGHIVPGHGGVLDRVDAVIMTAAVVFFYASWVGWK